jgi:hypothetical protein
MSRLQEYVTLLLLEEEEKEKNVMTAIEKVKPDLEKMSRAELELLQFKIDQMIKDL